MKSALALTLVAFVAVAVAAAPRVARADGPLPSGVVVLSETEDAWLHERCSFRGVSGVTPETLTPAGTIAESLGATASGTALVKTFRCVERPSFAPKDWKPAAPEALDCADAERGRVCTKPLRPPPPSPAVEAPPPAVTPPAVTPPAAVDPAPAPAPPPRAPKRKAKAPRAPKKRGERAPKKTARR